MKRLSEWKNETWLCNHCSMCADTICDDAGYYGTCPVFRQLGFECNTAKGHNIIALYLLQGSLKYSEDLADCVFKCTTCGTCMEICAPGGSISALMGGTEFKDLVQDVTKPLGIKFEGIRSVDIIKAMRTDCVELGFAPEPIKKMAQSAEKNHNPYDWPHEDRMKWAKGLNISSSAETVLFVGCRQAYESPEIAVSTAKILKQAGVNFAVLPEERCCGASLLGTGNVAIAEKLIKHNMDLLKQAKAKKVISLCGDGYKVMSQAWPEITGEKLPFEIVHITELLEQLISDGKIIFKNPINEKVTYHDPCHLGRGMKIYQPPRNVLKAIPGIELVEMYPNKHASYCCGAGGGIKVSNPDLALAIGAEKIPLVKKTGASLLTTSCGYCRTNFLDVIEKDNAAIEVKDITELVAQSMGI